METYYISKGLTIREGERTWSFSHEVAEEKVPTYIFIDQQTGKPRTLKIDELNRGIQSAQFKIVQRGDGATGEIKDTKRVAKISDLPNKYADDLLRKLAYVKAVVKKKINIGSRRQLDRFRSSLNGMNPGTKERDPHFPSVTTLYRWCTRYMKNGLTDSSLLSGNYARKRISAVHETIRKVINATIREVYLTRAENTQRDVHDEVLKKLKELADQGKIEVRQSVVSHATVRRYLAKFDPFEVMKARKGLSWAKHNFRYGQTAASLMPMARYEIDHTILDIVVLCPFTGMPLGRPTMTLVVDTASGYPTGVFLSFWGTGLATTLSALKVAISPKNDLIAALELSEPWYGYGIPMMFVVDNGLEFHSMQFMLAAAAMSIEVQFAPIRMGWYKAMVERRLQDVTRRLPSQGKVHKRIDNNYLPPNPEKSACITFDDLCANVVACLVTEIPFRPPEFRLSRSVDLFREAMETMLPPRMPGSMEDLNLIAAMRCDRTVSHNGVMVEWLPYRSFELAQVRRAVGQNFKAVVKFDPQNLSSVYVQNPLNNEWVLVPCAFEEYARGLSIVQHRAIRRFLKEDLTAANAYELFMQKRRELRERWAASAARGKRLSTDQIRALGRLTLNTALMGAEDAAEPKRVWVTPSPEQRQFLQDQWNALADHLKERLPSWGYPISTWIQGSYKYGTLIKPVHKGEEYVSAQ